MTPFCRVNFDEAPRFLYEAMHAKCFSDENKPLLTVFPFFFIPLPYETYHFLLLSMSCRAFHQRPDDK